MNTESDFQAMLDANPNDHYTRLVFADWLQDRDDPRAEGYRALGALRRAPREVYRGDRGSCWQVCTSDLERCPELSEMNWPHMIPGDWFVRAFASNFERVSLGRRVIENELAMAFSLLPDERRGELFAGATNEGATA